MMRYPLLVAWLLVSLLYLLSAVYFRIRYNGGISWQLTGTMFAIGGAIFLMVNKWWLFASWGSLPLEIAVLLLVLAAWGLIVKEAQRTATTENTPDSVV